MRRPLARPDGAEGCKGALGGFEAEDEDGRGGPAVSGGRVSRGRSGFKTRPPNLPTPNLIPGSCLRLDGQACSTPGGEPAVQRPRLIAALPEQRRGTLTARVAAVAHVSVGHDRAVTRDVGQAL
jgi:hypothetical protein